MKSPLDGARPRSTSETRTQKSDTSLSKIFGDKIPDIITEALERERQELAQEHKLALSHIERRLMSAHSENAKMRSALESAEKSHNSKINQVIEDFSEREAALQSRVSELLSRNEERERAAFDREKAVEAKYEARTRDLIEARRKLELRIQEYEKEKLLLEEESQRKIQENSKSFVEETVSALNKRGVALSRIAFWWSVGGGTALFVGAVALGLVSWLSAREVTSALSWKELIFYVLRGTVLIGAALIFARYAFIFASNYMKEGLRTFDRVHAIKFGQFFVNTYGATASWDQVQTVFSNWHGYGNADWNSSVQDAIKPLDNPLDLNAAMSCVDPKK